MSVAGRNAINGSTLEAFRPDKDEGTGGQTNVTWQPLGTFRMELHTPTNEVLQMVFGAGTDVRCTGYVEPKEEAWAGLEKLDLVKVVEGRHAGAVFQVTAVIENGRFRQFAFNDTTEEALP